MNELTQVIREDRTPLAGRLSYAYESCEEGAATWLDLSRLGASIRLGRYLRPGRILRLRFVSPLNAEERLELRARIVWCRAIQETPDFAAGLELLREEPKGAVALAALRHRAQQSQGAGASASWQGFQPLVQEAELSHAV